jgi:hypothetical protein
MGTKWLEIGRNILAVVGFLAITLIALSLFFSPQMEELRPLSIAAIVITIYLITDYFGLKIAPWIGVSAIVGIIIWIVILATVVAPF